MTKQKTQDWLAVTTFLAFCFVVAEVFVACPKGTSVQAGLSVKVDPATCKENKEQNSAPDLALLDCTSAEGTVRVVFPRKAWHEIKATADAGGVDAGPGK